MKHREGREVLVILVAVPLVMLLVEAFLGWKRNIIQSALKLLSVMVSIGLSVWIAKKALPQIIPLAMTALETAVDPKIPAYIQSDPVILDAAELAVTAAMPAVIFAVFLCVSLVLALLYLIPAHLLSDKAIARRESSDPAEGTAGHWPEWARISMKAASVLCSCLACFLTVAFLMLPVDYYSELVHDSTEDLSLDQLVVDDGALHLLEEIEAVYGHPINRMLGAVSGSVSNDFDYFTTHDGTTVEVSEVIRGMIQLLNTVSGITPEQPEPEKFYLLADQLEECPFVDRVFTQVAMDLFTAWGRGESFLGAEPVEIISPVISDIIYSALSWCEDFSELLRFVGDALKLQQFFPSIAGRWG